MTAGHARHCNRKGRIVRVDTPRLPRPAVTIDVRAGTGEWALADIKRVALSHPGEYRLALLIGKRLLTFGPDWNVDASRELVAALEPFGLVEVLEAAA